ncbi:MAG: substrate-binding domain-containing protein [Xanthomonadales bacterium]|nr:substrate-binding domain-containing protein [Xanthomonadales bacterium]
MLLSSRLIAAAALACLVGTLAMPATASAADELIWRGDQATGRSIMKDLAAEYAKQKRGKVVMQPFSTVSGLDAVAQGKADLAGSARGRDETRPEEANLEFLPVALDAAVMITHPSNPVQNLTMHQLYEIYFGRINNWKQLGGADKPINLYAIAAPLDGIEYSLRELVFNNGGKRVAAPRLYLNTIALEQAIAIDPAGLGLSTLGGVHSNTGVRMVNVEGVTPSTASVADGTYPLFITLYLVERNDDFHQDVIDRFREFLATPGVRDIVRKHQLVPYGEVADIAAKQEARLAFIQERMRTEKEAALALAAAAPAPVAPEGAELAAAAAPAPAPQASALVQDGAKPAAKPASAPAKAKPAKGATKPVADATTTPASSGAGASGAAGG